MKHDQSFQAPTAPTFVRHVSTEREPGYVWNKERELWEESDEQFRNRIAATLARF